MSKKIDNAFAVKRLADILRRKDLGYNRVITEEEQNSLDLESMGYLLNLYHIGSIDHLKLENLIDNCVTIAQSSNEKLQLERTKRVVNVLLFFDATIDKQVDIIPLFRVIDGVYGSDTIH